jgi:dsRNA-specific ribonuclease
VTIGAENARQPYSATVIINGMEYGKGFGSSKKQAKSEAGIDLLN